MEVAVPINFMAVIAAGLLSIVTGSLWYGPIFGKEWMRLMKMKKPDKMDSEVKMTMMKSYGLTTLASLVMAYVLAHSIVFASAYTNTTGMSAGLMAGFWSWLGFVVPPSLNYVLWESRPWKLWFINVGYHLVTLPLMGVVIAMWQ